MKGNLGFGKTLVWEDQVWHFILDQGLQLPEVSGVQVLHGRMVVFWEPRWKERGPAGAGSTCQVGDRYLNPDY